MAFDLRALSITSVDFSERERSTRSNRTGTRRFLVNQIRHPRCSSCRFLDDDPISVHLSMPNRGEGDPKREP
jgi:hypothetical protein